MFVLLLLLFALSTYSLLFHSQNKGWTSWSSLRFTVHEQIKGVTLFVSQTNVSEAETTTFHPNIQEAYKHRH